MKNLPESPGDVPPSEEARLVYPYSIIPGGVRSPEELAAHIAEDRVVSDHYSDFIVSRARMVKADKTRMMHVSYRMNDQVYWTRKKITIPEGELLVTDGDCEARARCGNRVSDAPMEPVADEEPLTETFDIPKLARITPPKPADLPPLAMQGDPLLFLVPDFQDPALYDTPSFAMDDPGFAPVPQMNPPIPAPPVDSEPVSPEIPQQSDGIPFPSEGPEYLVPEPTILVLLTTGLAGIFLFRLFQKK